MENSIVQILNVVANKISFREFDEFVKLGILTREIKEWEIIYRVKDQPEIQYNVKKPYTIAKYDEKGIVAFLSYEDTIEEG